MLAYPVECCVDLVWAYSGVDLSLSFRWSSVRLLLHSHRQYWQMPAFIYIWRQCFQTMSVIRLPVSPGFLSYIDTLVVHHSRIIWYTIIWRVLRLYCIVLGWWCQLTTIISYIFHLWVMFSVYQRFLWLLAANHSHFFVYVSYHYINYLFPRYHI